MGKIPTTLVRRPISLLSRSWGLLDQIWRQFALGNPVKAKISAPSPVDVVSGRVHSEIGEVVDHTAVLRQVDSGSG